jgi:hypothetical protein
MLWLLETDMVTSRESRMRFSMQRVDQVELTEFLYRLSSAQAEIVMLLRTTILTEDPQVHERL